MPLTSRRTARGVSCDEDWFAFGKNWAPLENDSELAALHGLAPFKTYRIDLASGRCTRDMMLFSPSHRQLPMIDTTCCVEVVTPSQSPRVDTQAGSWRSDT